MQVLVFDSVVNARSLCSLVQYMDLIYLFSLQSQGQLNLRELGMQGHFDVQDNL